MPEVRHQCSDVRLGMRDSFGGDRAGRHDFFRLFQIAFGVDVFDSRDDFDQHGNYNVRIINNSKCDTVTKYFGIQTKQSRRV